MAKLFESLSIRGVTFPNRVVMAPMCQYTAGTDGKALDWHLVHYGARAVGGAGLMITEATAVEPEGRISAGDLGLWEDGQIAPLARVIRFCQEHGAKMGVQLAHAGRKAWSAEKGIGPTLPLAPSPVPFAADWVTPAELDEAGIDRIVAAFGAAARRSRAVGFDVIELHGAHGYLIHEFLSPLSNKRNDAYGGSLENRLRFLGRVAEAVRKEWDGPLFLRVSASDYTEGGLTPADFVAMVPLFKQWGIDLVDVSSGGLVNAKLNVFPGYQVPFAAQIRAAGIPTGAVGLITEPAQAEEILATGQADMVFLARELLRDPQWPLRAAGVLGHDVKWPVQYERAKQ